MKFRVTLEMRSKQEGNPFFAGTIDRTHDVRLRTWEFEAKDEEEVRALYDEAKRQNLPNVQGFELRRIEPITPPTA